MPTWRGSGSGPALAAAAAAVGWAMVHQTLVPAILLVASLVLAAALSWRRWGAARRIRPDVVVIAVLALVLVAGGAAEPHRLPALVAGSLAVGMVPLSFDWTSADRVRLSLVAALIVQVTATSDLALSSAALRLLVWATMAATSLVLLQHQERSVVTHLVPGPAPSLRPRVDRRRVVMDVATVLAIAALATVAIPQLDLSPQRATAGRGGAAGEGSAFPPYLMFSDELDTSVRGEPGDAVVLRVQAAKPDLWRGQTFDSWDGRVWRRSAAGDTRTLSGSFPTTVPQGPGDEGVRGAETAVQRFEVLAPRSDLVFGAYRIEEVEVGSPTIIAEDDGSLRVGTPFGPGATYSVTSRQVDVTPELLRGHDPLRAELPPSIANLYLATDDVPDRVEDLARQVTAGAPTAYDKVKALEGWMEANTTYTREIPPLPPAADALEQHLFVDRRGYCEQIATSLVVMLRSVGVPARLVTGFVPGEESLLGGEFTVRASDGHAWTEVFFPGLGWQGFDPTASVPLPGEHDDSALASLLRLLGRLAVVAVALTVLATAIAVVLVVRAGLAWDRRRRARPWVTRFFRQLERAGVRRGRPRQPHETPAEYLGALTRSVLPDPRLSAVGDIVTEAAWSGRMATPTEMAWAESVLDEATKRWPSIRHGRRTERRRDGE